MKNLLTALFTMVFVLITGITTAQKATQLPNGNYVSVSKAKDSTKTASVSTGKTYTDAKGNVYPVFQGAKGGLYYIRVSKNTGKEYKAYLKAN